MIKEIMNWEICEKEHIKKIQTDKEKIGSIIKLTNARLKVIKQINKDDETASIITADYYEVIKELLTALLLKYGFKSDNHECLISFLKKYYKEYEYETNLIFELKNIRNRINYDGIFVRKSYLIKNELEFNNIIEILKNLINKK